MKLSKKIDNNKCLSIRNNYWMIESMVAELVVSLKKYRQFSIIQDVHKNYKAHSMYNTMIKP